jgi:hypothetical protein
MSSDRRTARANRLFSGGGRMLVRDCAGSFRGAALTRLSGDLGLTQEKNWKVMRE